MCAPVLHFIAPKKNDVLLTKHRHSRIYNRVVDISLKTSLFPFAFVLTFVHSFI